MGLITQTTATEPYQPLAMLPERANDPIRSMKLPVRPTLFWLDSAFNADCAAAAAAAAAAAVAAAAASASACDQHMSKRHDDEQQA